MKNNLTSLLACAAAVNLSSCVSRQGLPGDGESPVVVSLPTPDDVDTAEEAEDLADTLDTLRTAIETAKELDIKVPDHAIEAYNLVLEHLVKNNYFGFDHLRIALKDARLLKVQ